MTDLQGYLNSDYIKKLRFFAEDRTREFVFAYVEGKDDTDFWNNALNQFGNQSKFHFFVTTNKKAIEAGSDGKEALLRMKGLGPNKIVCIDADFDLIVDEYSKYTDDIRRNKYIINTTYYSIENVLLSLDFYPSLADSLKIEEDKSVYMDLLRWVSLTCCDIFLLLLTYAKSGSADKAFWFKEFSSCLNLISVSHIGNFAESQSYRDIWKTNYKNLFDAKKEEISVIHEDLNRNFCPNEQLYTLMRGHDLYGCIVEPWLKNKVNQTINAKIDSFKMTHQGKEISDYRKRLYEELGKHKGVGEFVRFSFYKNKPTEFAMPEQTAEKITLLFS